MVSADTPLAPQSSGDLAAAANQDLKDELATELRDKDQICEYLRGEIHNKNLMVNEKEVRHARRCGPCRRAQLGTEESAPGLQPRHGQRPRPGCWGDAALTAGAARTRADGPLLR